VAEAEPAAESIILYYLLPLPTPQRPAPVSSQPQGTSPGPVSYDAPRAAPAAQSWFPSYSDSRTAHPAAASLRGCCRADQNASTAALARPGQWVPAAPGYTPSGYRAGER
jgi:hypothetical protein